MKVDELLNGGASVRTLLIGFVLAERLTPPYVSFLSMILRYQRERSFQSCPMQL